MPYISHGVNFIVLIFTGFAGQQQGRGYKDYRGKRGSHQGGYGSGPGGFSSQGNMASNQGPPNQGQANMSNMGGFPMNPMLAAALSQASWGMMSNMLAQGMGMGMQGGPGGNNPAMQGPGNMGPNQQGQGQGQSGGGGSGPQGGNQPNSSGYSGQQNLGWGGGSGDASASGFGFGGGTKADSGW